MSASNIFSEVIVYDNSDVELDEEPAESPPQSPPENVPENVPEESAGNAPRNSAENSRENSPPRVPPICKMERISLSNEPMNQKKMLSTNCYSNCFRTGKFL